MTPLRRHSLVWLSRVPDAIVGDDRGRCTAWQAQGRPFVVTRRRGEGPAGVTATIGLGFCTTDPFHPELRPRRVAALTLPQHIVEVARPPALELVARCAPATRQADSFTRLQAAATAADLDIRVYGSWMWQTLTGERHVHEASDLDVVIDVATPNDADRAAALLAREEPLLSLHLDGELSFPGRGEVHWREYQQGKPEILLKSIDSLRLVARRELVA